MRGEKLHRVGFAKKRLVDFLASKRENVEIKRIGDDFLCFRQNFKRTNPELDWEKPLG